MELIIDITPNPSVFL